ncbi:MAG: PDGLE domain-containing protein [Acidimicrobiales bacterium]|nr:PDGLE domain-containing protein [Acidimicrobiales bacterium]
MKTNTKIFLGAGLLIGIALAVFVSPLASGSPDGLEKVAEEEGFADTATDHRLADSPLADYGIEGVDDENLSTGASGLIGVLLTLGVGLAIFGAARVLRNDEAGQRTEQRTESASAG